MEFNAQHFANLIIGGLLKGAMESMGGPLVVAARLLPELTNVEIAAVADKVAAMVAEMKKSEDYVNAYIKDR